MKVELKLNKPIGAVVWSNLPILAFGLCFGLELAIALPAQSQGQDISVVDGQGEELSIKHGLFGTKKKTVKDRFGNKYEHSDGLLGTSKKEVKILGSSYNKKKGLFGQSKTEVKTVLGANVSSKKSLFGRRKTTVDLSGVSKAISNLSGSVKGANSPDPSKNK